MNPAFWAGRRVFITGHTGFKGSWLSLWLGRSRAELTGFSLDVPTEPSLFEQARVREDLRSLRGDVRDVAQLSAALAEAAPEVVFHLAAQALVRPSYEDPVRTYSTNVMGTVHCLEAVRKTPSVRVCVVVTSDKCYDNRESEQAYREEDRLGGFEPYSSSKAGAELVTSAYRTAFFSASDRRLVAVASARAGNVIGGGDWARDRVVPDAIRAFLAREPVRLRYPDAVRPWQHVLEPLDGYLSLAERLWKEGPAFAEPWNFGPDEEDARPVRWLVERLGEAWGMDRAWRPEPAEQLPEAHQLRLDSSKARRRLGWHPRLSLSSALAWTSEWYLAHREAADLRAKTAEQIQRYEALPGPC